MSPSPGSNWANCPYKELPAARPKGHGALGAPRTHAGQPFRLVPLPLGYESIEPLRGVEPRKPPVRRTTGRLPERHGCRARTRTSIRGFRGRCPAIRRPGIEHGRREPNPHLARFELVASAFELCPRAPPGTRTLFAGVRVRNIAIHARGTWSGCHATRSGWEDSNLRFPAPEAGALPLGYTQSRGDGRNRTRYGNACRARPLPLAVIPMRRRMAPAG